MAMVNLVTPLARQSTKISIDGRRRLKGSERADMGVAYAEDNDALGYGYLNNVSLHILSHKLQFGERTSCRIIRLPLQYNVGVKGIDESRSSNNQPNYRHI